MEGSNLRIGIIGTLMASTIAFGCPEFLHQEQAYISLAHHFFHANLFHLAVNCLSIWAIFRKGVEYSITPLVIAFLIASGSWFCTSADPIGFSNIIFALAGLRTPSLKSTWWKRPNVIAFFVITIAMAFLPQVSTITHLVSFILGCCVACVLRAINKILYDYRRASYHQ